jgi:uracil-DNA glycosylase
VLDAALEEAGLDRKRLFLTNAVKHFKFEPCGKRRLHQNPTAAEIDICRWWLDKERQLVRPDVIVTLGARALRGVTGKSASIKSMGGASTRRWCEADRDHPPLLFAPHARPRTRRGRARGLRCLSGWRAEGLSLMSRRGGCLPVADRPSTA